MGVTRQHSPAPSSQNQVARKEDMWNSLARDLDPMRLVENVVSQTLGGRLEGRKNVLNKTIAEMQTTLRLLEAGFDSLPGGESAKVQPTPTSWGIRECWSRID
jgi:hypothetical protein